MPGMFSYLTGTDKKETGMARAFVSETRDGKMWTSTYRHPGSMADLMQNFTPDDFQLVVSLAASALHNLQSATNNIQYKEAITQEISKVLEEHKKDTEKAEKAYEKEKTQQKKELEGQISDLEDEIKRLRSSLTVAEFSATKTKEQFEELRKTSETTLKGTIEEIVRQKEESHKREVERIEASMSKKDDSHAKEVERLQAMHRSILESLEKSGRERMEQAERHHKEAQEVLQKQFQEREEKLKADIEKTSNSSEKGKIGEMEFEEIALKFTQWPRLENTSKTAHGTDRKCTIRNCEVLFEIKNYSNDVPSKEVEKFQRDMEEHQDVPLGIFISLKTSIVGKKSNGFITMSWTNKHQLLIFINSFYTHPVQEVMTFLDMCVDIAASVFKGLKDKPQESETTLQLQGRIQQIKVFIEKELKRMTELLGTLNLDKKMLIDTITKQNANYVYQAQQTKHALQGVMEILLGQVVEEVTPAVQEAATPPAPQAEAPVVAQATEAVPQHTRSRGRPKKNVEAVVLSV
jgi:hypothetical protein